MATQSCILAWRIQWTEEPGGLQSVGSHLRRLSTSTLPINNGAIVSRGQQRDSATHTHVSILP